MRDLELALKAAADPTRTRILKLLQRGGLCVCQVQAVLGLAPSTVSKHLAILKLAGLVEDRRDGKWIHYALADGARNPHATALLTLLRGRLDRDPRVLADRRRLDEVEALPIEQVCGVPRRRQAGRPAARAARPARRAGRAR